MPVFQTGGKQVNRTVTLKGKPLALAGPDLKTGQKAPDFRMLAADGTEVSLADSRGNIRLMSIVHSLDTPICDLQTQKFEEEAAKFPGVVIYAISMDLPFAQGRYCSARNIKNLKTLSDHRDASFGRAYGVLIEELRLHSRAIFIIDREDIVRYVEYVPEVAQHPNYDKAIEALKGIAALAGQPAVSLKK
ncbi:MAG: thiol peroxidase [Chloroflexi bacterium]|nr:thiol peroxidase [Chloroflexota bacterium]